VAASTARRCERCGAQLSRYNHESICAPCHAALVPASRTELAARPSHPLAARVRPAPTWLWVSPSAQAALAGGDLAAILTAYRHANRLSQAQLAAILGLDQPYVSRIESGARKVRDIRMLARIADRLAIPPHLLGVVGADDADFAAMLQFAEATLRLSEIARQSGRAADAVSALAVAPQWRVIDQVTVGNVLLAGGDVAGALETLETAMVAAEAYRLPHQIQRAMRMLGSVPREAARTLVEAGTGALARLRRLLSAPTASP